MGGQPFSHDGNDIGVLLMPRVHRCAGFDARRGPTTSLPRATPSRLPLLPGHGTRWQDANRTTFDDWLAAVTAELRQLTERCRAVVVCGLSMGGTLTLRLAELYPDAMAGIVLVNPSVLTLHWEAKAAAGAALRVLPSFPRDHGRHRQAGDGRARLHPATGQGDALAVARLAGRPPGPATR